MEHNFLDLAAGDYVAPGLSVTNTSMVDPADLTVRPVSCMVNIERIA